MKSKIFFVMYFLVVGSVAWGSPSITNVTIDGATATVSGTGFGTKIQAAPLSYLSGEGETNNSAVNDSDYVYEESNRYIYTTSNQHSGSGCIKTTIMDWPDGAYMYYDYGSGGTDQVYMSFWVKFSVSGTYETASACQIKWLSVRSVPIAGQTPYAGYGYYPWFTVGPGNVFSWYTFEANIGYDGAYGTYRLPYPCNSPCIPEENWDTMYVSSPNDKIVYDQYFRVEWYGKRATGGNVSDGTWITKILQPGSPVIVTHNRDGNAITHASTDEIWRYAGFRNELTNTSDIINEELEIWIDDFVIDNTRKRVEIGNNAVFANCTHREIQPALTWSDNEITGTFNQGSFETGDTVYFFVIDEDGVPSEGHAVTIGGEPVIANPVVEILTESGQTTTASIFEITGTATADTGQTISGVTCDGQTVTPDDGIWDEQVESFTCLASLALGENALVFVGSDGTRTGQDSITVARTRGVTSTSVSHGVLRH